MPLDPFFTERFRALQQLAVGDPADPVTQAAQHFLQTVPTWHDPEITVSEATIPGPHGPIPLRVYRPPADPTSVLLWAHGGGFRHGDLAMPEAHMVSGELARRAGAHVVSVGYRLATDGLRYPVPIDDVHAAWSWLCTEGLPDAAPERWALGGASAGAALALATALRARDGAARTPDALLLAYPFAHFPNPALDHATAHEMATLPAFARHSPEAVEDMVRNYVGRISDLPRDALPGAARLDGLPPTCVLLCEYDDLRPSGELLARQLSDLNVSVRCRLARGMAHGHLNQMADLPAISESLDFFAEALR
jgi:acetyl esterase